MNLLHALADTLFPTLCASCGEVLLPGERQLCLRCMGTLSLAEGVDFDNNTAARTLLGRIPFVEALALCHYHPDSVIRNVVHDMKFRSNAELCLLMGRLLGQALLRSARFDGVDLLLPVPLHPLRRYQRGFNQSELLCRGIAQVLPRPIVTGAVVRHRFTRKQSRLGHTGRAENVEGAFRLRRPNLVQGRHVLLVDDVLTTGSTLTACFDALRPVPGLRVSVAALAVAAF